MKNSLSNQKGFTLIEVMIVTVLMGILASISVPAYVGYVSKGKAEIAKVSLSEMRLEMERYFQDNRTYDGAQCNSREAKYFDYECAGPDGSGAPDSNGYTLKAIGKSSENLEGYLFTVDEFNNKTSRVDGGDLIVGCWASKKDAC